MLHGDAGCTWEERALEDVRVLIGVMMVLIYALVSRRLGRWWISMPMAMIVFGLILGADGLGLIAENPQSEIVKVTAELTLALVLFHDAVRIDSSPRMPPGRPASRCGCC